MPTRTYLSHAEELIHGLNVIVVRLPCEELSHDAANGPHITDGVQGLQQGILVAIEARAPATQTPPMLMSTCTP